MSNGSVSGIVRRVTIVDGKTVVQQVGVLECTSEDRWEVVGTDGVRRAVRILGQQRPVGRVIKATK